MRELVEDGKLRVTFVRTADNYADLFTKPLDPKTFFPLRDLIMNVPLSMRESGGASATGGHCKSSRGVATGDCDVTG